MASSMSPSTFTARTTYEPQSLTLALTTVLFWKRRGKGKEKRRRRRGGEGRGKVKEGRRGRGGGEYQQEALPESSGWA